MEPLRVGLLGLGTVGQGVLRVLAENTAEVTRRAHRPIRVTRAAVRELSRARDCPLDGVALTDDPAQVVAAPDVDVVVELIGGLEPAGVWVEQALRTGKPVVTANKALVAEQGNRLIAAAQEAGVPFGFEAAVAGGIPVIRALREGLAGNRILEVAGIINGTCNYILCEMAARGVEFADALPDAQRMGYAEADPRFDVEGVDAAHKLAILAAIAFGMPLAFDRIIVEGITGVQVRDLRLAAELGYRIKHLGVAKRDGERVELRVHPTLIPQEHLLAKVDGALNAVLLQGSAAGPVGLYGRGAGAEATASAVVADLVEVARLAGADGRHLVAPMAVRPADLQHPEVLAAGAIRSAYYVRLRVADTPGVLRAISEAVAARDISIEAILQKEPRTGEDATVAIITSVTEAAQLDAALEAMVALPFVRERPARLRVEHLGDAA